MSITLQSLKANPGARRRKLPKGRGIAAERLQAGQPARELHRGFPVGVAFEGAGITMDRKANVAFYGSSSMTPEKIFASSPNIAPNIANDFVQILTAQTARLPRQPGMSTGTTSAPSEPATTPNVRTFGVPDPDEEPDDPGY